VDPFGSSQLDLFDGPPRSAWSDQLGLVQTVDRLGPTRCHRSCQQAEALFGVEGVMDIVVLVGIYHTVCAILNVFAIPAAC
jgi:hypothetical protein